MTRCASIRRAFTLLVALAAPLVAAQTVSSVVTTADLGAVPGANVVIDGTFVGVATDAQGRFSLSQHAS